MPVEERFGPTRRGGPVFRWLGEPLAIDLANTVMVIGAGGLNGDAVDLLAAPGDLERWLGREGERLAGFDIDVEADLSAVRGLRDALRSLLAAAVEGVDPPLPALELVNALSAASPVSPQLSVEAEGGYTLGARTEESVAGLLAAVARSAIQLLAETPAGKLRICRAPSCGMFYLGGRRWCCSACGNRARAARHYRPRRLNQ
jgi:predicted RNA-binding Zn ribbon-like protein